MKPSINLSHDGKLIQIFIPAQLGRRSGRKTILSPTGQPVNPDRNTEADVTLIVVVTSDTALTAVSVRSGSVPEIVFKQRRLAMHVRYGRQMSGLSSQRVPASYQRAGTQWRPIAGFYLNIRLFGDFERIIHFDAQIGQMCSCTFDLLN